VGPRAGTERCGKSRPPPGFDSRTVQPVASLIADFAVLVYHYKRHDFFFPPRISVSMWHQFSDVCGIALWSLAYITSLFVYRNVMFVGRPFPVS
jgi:hypothetical protein